MPVSADPGYPPPASPGIERKAGAMNANFANTEVNRALAGGALLPLWIVLGCVALIALGLLLTRSHTRRGHR
jgi:hypothetical protein